MIFKRNGCSQHLDNKTPETLSPEMFGVFIPSHLNNSVLILGYSRSLVHVAARKQKERTPAALKKIKHCLSVWLAGIECNKSSGGEIRFS